MARIAKPHGLVGEVVVELWSDLTDRLHPGAEFSTPQGTTLRVETVRPHQHRWLVAFAGVVDREGADRLRGTELLAPPTEVEGALWVHELVGARMVDTSGRELGTVEAVEANPASDLLVLAGGALVPARFVVSHQPGVLVTVDVPEGLVEVAGEPAAPEPPSPEPPSPEPPSPEPPSPEPESGS